MEKESVMRKSNQGYFEIVELGKVFLKNWYLSLDLKFEYKLFQEKKNQEKGSLDGENRMYKGFNVGMVEGL